MTNIRYNLHGKYQWCLNAVNGWIRIHYIIIRWNTTWTIPYTYFSITSTKK